MYNIAILAKVTLEQGKTQAYCRNYKVTLEKKRKIQGRSKAVYSICVNPRVTTLYTNPEGRARGTVLSQVGLNFGSEGCVLVEVVAEYPSPARGLSYNRNQYTSQGSKIQPNL